MPGFTNCCLVTHATTCMFSRLLEPRSCQYTVTCKAPARVVDELRVGNILKPTTIIHIEDHVMHQLCWLVVSGVWQLCVTEI